MRFNTVKDFLGKSAPPGYVPGLGRGAAGFVTRADVGPGREVDESQPLPISQNDRQDTGDEKAEDDAKFEDAQNSVNEFGLLGSTPLDKEDEEADLIWASIDDQLDSRRRARREAKERENLEKNKNLRPKVQEQFSDLKRDLATMSSDEWSNIPEPGDLVALASKSKRAREREREREVYTPVSDILLNSARAQSQLASSIDAQSSGMVSSLTSGTETSLADFRQISKARDDLLKVKLDQQATSSDSASGKTTVDPRGYLTSLNSIVIKSASEIGDMKKAKELLNSVITTNPKHAPGWIAAARVDELDGKLGSARAKIARACEECPKSEDVWLEAARLNTSENAKVILANAVREIPDSARIWLNAMDLEKDSKSKKRVIRKALEYIPNSVKLWKAAVELEDDPADARIMLARAVECIPLSVELWLALARLETYEKARIVLNKARKANPSSHEIWVAAAQLEESAGHEENVDMLIHKGIQSLANHGANLSRQEWIKEAESMEKVDSILTCHAIIRAALGMNIEDDEKKETWISDANSSLKHGGIETARAIFVELIKAFPDDESVWLKAVNLEKEKGTIQTLDSLLQRATQKLTTKDIFWLMRAKEKWTSGDMDGSRAVLADAFRFNPDSEQIWLAAVKLEAESGEFDKARALLRSAREKSSAPRIWLKSAVLERNLRQYDTARALLTEALEKYPSFDKLWMMKAQLEEDENQSANARITYSNGVKNCPKSLTLWKLYARFEQNQQNTIRARAVLDKARSLNPKNAELWVETVRIEQRAKNESIAKTTLAKALQECPQSGTLWTESIFMEPRPARKSRSVDALKKCDNDAVVVVAVGRLFWQERNIEKARSWLNRAVKINPDLGDAWAWLYKFEIEHGLPEQQEDVLKRFIQADPHHGELWPQLVKSPANFRANPVDILKTLASQLSS